MRIPRLTKKGGSYPLRVAVPLAIRPIIGKTELWRSLSSDRSEALRRLPQASEEADRLFFAAKRSLSNEALQPVASNEVTAAVVRWFARVDRRQQDLDFASPPSMRDLSEEALDLSRDWEDGTGAEVLAAVNDVLSSHPQRLRALALGQPVLEPDISNETRAETANLVHRAMRELHARRRSRLAGIPHTGDPMFRSQGITVNEATEQFLAAHVGNPKSTSDYRNTLELVRHFVGTRAVSPIQRGDLRDLKACIRSMPQNATKLFPSVPIMRAIDRARKSGQPPISTNTQRAYLARISALFSWCYKEGLLSENPAANIAHDIPKERNRREPFTTEELRTIFRTHHTLTGARYWVPLLGLHSGCRLGELYQLAIDDILEVEGITCLRIDTRHPWQHVKTPASRRLVPIHSRLLKPIVAYVKDQTDKLGPGQQRLFPGITCNSRGSLSDSFQKWHNRRIQALGVKKTFHGYRHFFVDLCRTTGMPESHMRALVGHADQSMMGRYGAGPSITSLKASVERLSFPELDVSDIPLSTPT